jgi:hypothetical protein
MVLVLYNKVTNHTKGESVMVKYFTKPLLMKANKEAIRKNRNRALKPEVLESLDEDLKFPVVFTMPHNDVEMRLGILLNPETEGFIDVPLKTWETLPKVPLEKHNS